jgi:hypothetical protein
MQVDISVRPLEPEITERRRAWAERVVEALKDELPNMRLLVCLDATNCLTPRPDVRGFFIPNDKYYYLTVTWPDHLAKALRTITNTGFEAKYHYDAMVYLPQRTCEREESLTMTLAHELRHFVQFGFNRRVWAWNGVVTNLTREFLLARGMVWKDIPMEYEARLYAKRLCEVLIGSERTAKYIDLRIDEHVNDRDAADWQFVKGLDVSSEYEMVTMTKELFRSLADEREKLQESLDDKRLKLPEFREMQLDEMLPGRL